MLLAPGDLIKCGTETGLVLSLWDAPDGEPEHWCDVLWCDGIEPVCVEDIDEVVLLPGEDE